MNLPSMPASRFRVEAFVAFLLVATFALPLHIQSAKFEQPFTFPTKHILHGDLRPDTEYSAQIVHQAGSSSAPALPMGRALLAPRIVWRPIVYFFDRLDVALLRHLARFFRAPPPFRHSIS